MSLRVSHSLYIVSHLSRGQRDPHNWKRPCCNAFAGGEQSVHVLIVRE